MREWALVLALGLAACATDRIGPEQLSPFERRGLAAVNRDRDITAHFYDALADQPALARQASVTATAFNGLLLLTGEAVTGTARDQLLMLARLIPHVRQVHNNIAIAPPRGPDIHQRDARITANVIAALGEIKGIADFNPGQVQVVTANAQVYLMGLLRRQEGAVVVNVVRQVPDVQKIIKVFEYLD